MERPQPIWPADQPVDSRSDGQMFYGVDGRHYLLTRSLTVGHEAIAASNRVAFTRYILDHPEADPVIFSTANIDAVLRRAQLPFARKVQLVLRELVRWFDGKPGRDVLTLSAHIPDYVRILQRSGLDLDDTFRHILQYLESKGLIEARVDSDGVRITLKIDAIIEVENDLTLSSSNLAFVAMWFDPVMASIYDDAIAPAIEATGHVPVRIDRQEHNNKIDDEIIAEIRRSKFVVADFSCGADGARGGVYYEAGFAAGLGKPVIHCARERDMERVHFDTRQINHIAWIDASDLRARLENRIAATIGRA